MTGSCDSLRFLLVLCSIPLHFDDIDTFTVFELLYKVEALITNKVVIKKNKKIRFSAGFEPNVAVLISPFMYISIYSRYAQL